MIKDNLYELIYQNIQLINKGLISFKMSLIKCKTIDFSNDLSFEQQESLDSLTSKFARIADIYTQKILKSICYIYREDCKTFIDRSNFAEKLGLISDSQFLLDIRDLRNEISHEYIEDEITEIYQKTIEVADNLIEIIEKTISHLQSSNFFGKQK